jgi:hypothetical protein
MIWIFQLAVVLLTLAGAWRAWKASPSFSGKRALGLAAVLLAELGVVVWVLVSIVNHVTGTMEFVLLGSLVALMTPVLIGTIMRMSEVEIVLAPSVIVPHLHRKRVRRIALKILAWVAGACLLAQVLPEIPRIIILSLAGVGMLAGLGAGTAAYLQAGRFDRGLAAIQADPWIHWIYTSGEWAEWVAIQEKLLQPAPSKSNRKGMAGALSLIIGLFALGSVFAGSSWTERGLLLGGLTAFTLVLFAAASLSGKPVMRAKLKRLREAPLEAYLGAEGLFAGGQFAPLASSGFFLVAARVETAPRPALRLEFIKSVGLSAVTDVRLVPFPQLGKGDDLESVQAKLLGRCPKAAVHLAEKASHKSYADR